MHSGQKLPVATGRFMVDEYGRMKFGNLPLSVIYLSLKSNF